MTGSQLPPWTPQDDEVGHESHSDEDHKAVEVMFGSSASPYRRKSSLVTSFMTDMPQRLHRADKTECFVHQFLETQQRARRRESAHDRDDDDEAQQRGRDGRHSSRDVSEIQGRIRLVEHKGSGFPGTDNGDAGSARARCSILDDDIPSDAGQEDEQHWKRGIGMSTSDVDLLRSDRNGAKASSSVSSVAGGANSGSGPASNGSASTPGGQDATHSRLLTKKQLSDMAWGVRQLSRRLGSIRLKFRVKSIFVLTKIYDPELVGKTRELARWLLDRRRDVRYTVYIERSLRDSKRFDAPGLLDELHRDYEANDEEGGCLGADKDIGRRLRYWDEHMCRTRPHTFDFVITLGGDGTVLYASWLFQRIVPPVLSFALGSLGFLTKFDFEEYESTLTSAFNDGVTVSLRLRFEGTLMRSQKRRPKAITPREHGDAEVEDEEEPVKRDLVEELIGEEKDDEHTHRPDGTYEILNEIVVDRGPNPTMSYTEIFGDDEHFTSVLADGLCVSTPTGSTAYNLAAGGSLCHPENPVMLVTSICAHTLSFRPIILPDTTVLRVGVPYDARTSSWASFDGRERVELHPGDYVTVSASRYPFASVQAQGRRSEDWINSISGKLGWNTRQKQKGYEKWDR